MHRREKDGLRRFLLELKEERLAVAEAAHSGASCDIGHIKELREVLKQIKDVGEHKFEACPESERYLNAADHTEEELAVMEDSVDLLDEASHLATAGAGISTIDSDGEAYSARGVPLMPMTAMSSGTLTPRR